MTKNIPIIIALASIALTSCGKSPVESKSDDTGVIHGKNGDVTMTHGEAPLHLPPYAPLYPGAKIESVVETDATTGSGGVVSFTVPDAPATVMAFYKKAALDSKLTNSVGSPPEDNGTQLMIFSQPDSQRSFTVSLEPAETGTGTKVGLTYGAP